MSERSTIGIDEPSLGEVTANVATVLREDGAEVQEVSHWSKDLRVERYAAATGSNEILYLGTAAPGTATSAADWNVRKFDHDANGLIEVLNATGAWDDRATLF